MGASQSLSDDRGQAPPSKALHVLRVTPSSPASETDIEPFFDFLVGVDNTQFSTNINAFELEKVVEAHEGKILPLLVWNAKYRTTRVVPITPSRTWSQTPASTSAAPPSLLGLSMRLCTPESALENVWHILEVLEGSPAESAGLVPYGDWILGWAGGVLASEGDFYEVVESHIDKPLRVYVFSYDFDTIREVVLVPNRQWGGEGLLGCGVGYGLLHRIPSQPANPRNIEAILDQNLSYDGESFPEERGLQTDSAVFIPADVETFEFGGQAGYPRGLDEPSNNGFNVLQEDFETVPPSTRQNGHPEQSHERLQTLQQSHSGHSHNDVARSQSHNHVHDDGHAHLHSHSHSHEPSSDPPLQRHPKVLAERPSPTSPSHIPTSPPPVPSHSPRRPPGQPRNASFSSQLRGINGSPAFVSTLRTGSDPIRRIGSPLSHLARSPDKTTGFLTPKRVQSPEVHIHKEEHDGDETEKQSTSGSIPSVD